MAEAGREQRPARFRDRDIVFANGARGRNIDIPSASPLNYRQVISENVAAVASVAMKYLNGE